MKTLVICMCMIVSCIYAQEKDNYFAISLGFDVKNAIVGSKPTNNESALNWTGQIHAVAENIDFGLGYEAFNRLNYDRKFVSLGYHFPIAYLKGKECVKFTIQPSLEWSNITREWVDNGLKQRQSFSTPSININWNVDLTKHFAIQLNTNWLPRPDIRVIYHQKHNKYVLNEAISVVYKL